MIKENVDDVESRVQAACSRAGRKREEVTLIAVSKTKPVSAIYEVMETGIKDYGENKVQELCDKIDIIKEPLNWHMIGHLQRNKVKYIVDKVKLIHSVDSLRLAEQISVEAQKKSVETDILIEVNVAEETSKFGLSTDEVVQLVRDIAKLPAVHIKGLMTVAPFTDNPEDNRPYFKNLKQLAVDIAGKNIDNVTMNELSMGMTGDYEVAIEEGATMVRVGTGIFGARIYAKNV
ncbi:MAG: YggS family pyridoxal phosphate-dependent enzyme [Clostridia bacterium]|nr:YggS family pyridoxal phosphate-dependent enzyme [Lachnospiraceae bacterium]NCC00638.1 YggS family pyridoxal phosphate-dependent enzyme [Clostridia bacterium]NCD02650.1 YggS family pyridoxal phosphate-dependent enzyme [Clostridia bacterium]